MGVYARPSASVLAAIIGIQKAGKAYVPIDSNASQARVRHMISDSGLDLLITDVTHSLMDIGLNDAAIDTLLCSESDCAQQGLNINVPSSDAPAYMKYNWDSTEHAQGIVIGHGSLLNFLLAMKTEPGCSTSDLVLALTSMSLDASVLEYFLPLICGAQTHIAPQDLVSDPVRLIELLEALPFTIIQAAPRIWKLLMDRGFSGNPGQKFLCGGEAMSAELANRLYRSGRSVWNLYGAPETCAWSSLYRIENIQSDAPSIGKPIINSAFHILDEQNQLLPDGEVGRLWISGKTLAAGYWKNGEITRSAFQALPGDPAMLAHKTGDDASRMHNGSFRYHGPSDCSENETQTVKEEPESGARRSSELRLAIRKIWTELLKHDNFSEDDNFFDIGGYSMLLVRMVQRIRNELSLEITPMTVFQHPSLNLLYEALQLTLPTQEPPTPLSAIESEAGHGDIDDFSIAIVGYSCAVPGAENSEEFWRMLCEGVSGISEYSVEELINSGIPEDVVRNEQYVRRSGNLASTPFFDATFFGYSPNEAKFMDPQHRLMLQHSYWALEHAGIVPEAYGGRIGTFLGSGQNHYLQKNLLFNSEARKWPRFQTMIGNESDFLATRVAYKLQLTGPALSVQTACSTSLVAVQMGYQALLNFQCDAAICGGVSLNIPIRGGYMYEEGSILSPDGLCRAFDASASGTIFGSGVGAVVLKRLSDARQNNDRIIAVIRSAAVNNDGRAKVGYTAPSVHGQQNAILDALTLAELNPEQIGYVETHGTGTILGDPIEIAGLAGAHANGKTRSAPCYIGSVKTNVGHLDAAAGVIGLIKTALSLQHKQIPPSLNFSHPNPDLHLERTPFVVNSKLRDWEPIGGRRIAGVSSFGIGGTNAHAILESWETPNLAPPSGNSREIVIPFSTKNGVSLAAYGESILNFLKTRADVSAQDIAYTFICHRSLYDHRAYVHLAADASRERSELYAIQVSTRAALPQPQLVFLFPGQGSEYPGMGLEQSLHDSSFAKYYDNCLDELSNMVSWNPREILNSDKIHQTEFTQPLLFAMEWSAAKSMLEYGIEPAYMLGHSLGEYVAACIAGAYTLLEGLAIVVRRGKLMAGTEQGRMLAIFHRESELHAYLEGIDIAAINSPNQLIASGSGQDILMLKSRLEHAGLACKLLPTSSAFHSRSMDPILEDFSKVFEPIEPKPIARPVIGNLEGNVLEPGFVYGSDYWQQHLRSCVRFEQGIRQLNEREHVCFLELGPGNILSNLTRSIRGRGNSMYVSTLDEAAQLNGWQDPLKRAFADLWVAGLDVDMTKIQDLSGAKVASVPRYPFENQRHWVEPDIYIDSAQRSIQPKDDAQSPTPANSEVQGFSDKLSEIWKSVLGYQEISEDDNFFDLGGDSLLSAELVKHINRDFHMEFKINDVILYPIFREMSQELQLKIDSSEASSFPILFPVQKEGRKPALFLVAGAHQNRYFDRKVAKSSYEEDFMRYFSSMINFLGKDQPIYGFRPKGIFFGEQAHKNVQEMSEDYIAEMKKVQPNGPYFIGGECVGGIVAYEIAQQLRQMGDEVLHLLLMDTPKPSVSLAISEELQYRRHWLGRMWKEHIRPAGLGELLRNSLELAADIFYFFFTISRKQYRRKQITESSLYYQRKLLKYHPRAYDGKTTLIINQQWSRTNPHVKWPRKLLANQDVHVVPGDHLTRLSEYGHVSGKIVSRIVETR